MDKLTVGFSPCPNDTFIFDAMVHHKVDTEGLEFDYLTTDVEELNLKAFRKELDVTKLSYHAFLFLTDEYVLLRSGSALGHHCGPLLISDKECYLYEIDEFLIGIPGRYTTANLLLGIAAPSVIFKKEMLFSDIEDAILRSEIDAGVIIHENRFTYQEKGLKLITDLGEYWEGKTGYPIPLGGIVVRRDFPEDLKQKINRVMRRSVEFAMNNPDPVMDFVKAHAQTMHEQVMRQHIALYVNQYTLDLGEEGMRAVVTLTEKAKVNGICPLPTKALFV